MINIKSTKIYIIARMIIQVVRILKAYFYDFLKYVKYSNTFKMDQNAAKLRATIILNYHVIEKGLTMPEMKKGFGQEKILYLCSKCHQYFDKYGNDDVQVNHAVNLLKEYIYVHKKINFELPDLIINEINKLSARHNDNNIRIGDEIDTFTSIQSSSFPVFAKSRKSIRNYSNENITIQMINSSISIAQTAPSACNRQPSKVHIYGNKDKIESILSLQNGNRGFGHLANKLLIVTADLSGYKTENERNACWIDGGIYVMNLLYALHYNEIGACVLNWGVNKKKDRQLKVLSNIPENENIIAIITCGIKKKESKDANSLKKHYTEAVVYHDNINYNG